MRAFLQGQGRRAWLVGGTVRDFLLGLQPLDIDLATLGDPRDLARSFADSIGGSFFVLSDQFKACRVVSPDRGGRETGGQAAHLPGSGATWDFVALRGGTIAEDLRSRDFSVNAMAIELPPGEAVIDPLGGLGDLAARRLKAASGSVFDDDPLRLLRAVRLERESGFRLDRGTEALVRSRARLAARPAPERIFAELVRLLQAPAPAAAIRRLDGLGLLKPLLPEVYALKGIGQNEYHHLDVYHHTLANMTALDRIIRGPAAFFPEQAEQLRQRQGRSFAGAGWRFIMVCASLLHDIAKPLCRFTDDDGQVRFFEHDRLGAGMAAAMLRRFKAGTEAMRAVSFLVRRHMRFEGLLQQRPASARARLRYLRATAPFAPELIMLSVSDRLSVRGRLVSVNDIESHLLLARETMEMCFAREAAPPPRLVSGDDLIRELSLKPGPVIGRLLDRIEEEQQLGRVTTRRQAFAAAVRLLGEVRRI